MAVKHAVTVTTQVTRANGTVEPERTYYWHPSWFKRVWAKYVKGWITDIGVSINHSGKESDESSSLPSGS